MKIYTSYFSQMKALNNAGIVPINIALWPPKFFRGISIMYLAPKRYMLSGKLTREQYIESYRRDVLGRLNPVAVVREIERLSGGKDAALLCYEKPGEFCHRRLFAQWMLEETGLDIPEWGQEKREEQSILRRAKKEVVEEPSLFELQD